MADRAKAVEAIAAALCDSGETWHIDAEMVADCIEAACEWMPHCIGCGDHTHGFDPDEHVWAAVIAAMKRK